MRELGRHSLDLVLKVVPQSSEDACEQVSYRVHHLQKGGVGFKPLSKHYSNLVVMVFERHLQVEPHKLREMPVCVGIFCPEDSANSEDLKHQAVKSLSTKGSISSRPCQNRRQWPSVCKAVATVQGKRSL